MAGPKRTARLAGTLLNAVLALCLMASVAPAAIGRITWRPPIVKLAIAPPTSGASARRAEPLSMTVMRAAP